MERSEERMCKCEDMQMCKFDRSIGLKNLHISTFAYLQISFLFLNGYLSADCGQIKQLVHIIIFQCDTSIGPVLI